MSLRLVHNWNPVDPPLHGPVVAVADFDGLHRGHQQLIAAAAQTAARLGAPLGVVSIERSSALDAHTGAKPSKLTNLGQQVRLLDSLGVDILYRLPFDEPMSGVEVELFVRDALNHLGVRHAFIGEDLADMRSAALHDLGEAAGVPVSLVEDGWSDRGGRFSTDAARAALKTGRTEVVQDILGRPFAIEGVVIEGQKLGRQLGYPTANVAASDYVRPRLGVYATRSRLPDGREIPGVANFGVNPTTGLVEARLEVWLFDFDEDIYGQNLETDLIQFLRPELKFNGLTALIDQIGQDVEDARAILFTATGEKSAAAVVA